MNSDTIYAEYLLAIDGDSGIPEETRNAFVSMAKESDAASETPGRYYSSVFYAIINKATRMFEADRWTAADANRFVIDECSKNGVTDYFGGEGAFEVIAGLETPWNVPSEDTLAYVKDTFERVRNTEFAADVLKSDVLRRLLQILIANNLILEDKEFSRTLIEANKSVAGRSE